MINKNEMIEKGQKVLVGTYKQMPVIFEGGEGCSLIDSDGNKYLDFVGGIAVNALGYNDPKLTKAIKDVLEKGVLHTSNLYWNPYEIKAAEKLVKLSNMSKVFYCNSGAEANEAALKLARKYGSKIKGRSGIISMENSFHGRTIAAVTATGQDKYHKDFYPLLSGITYGKYNDLKSVEDKIDNNTCAIIVEPLQGEGGIIPATQEFLQGLRKIADEKDLILIFDEVQCGMGRSGKPFCHQWYGIKPDVMTLAKALGGGLPCGAMVTDGKANGVLTPGSHASTFGGNHAAMAASYEVLSRIEGEVFLKNVNESSEYLIESLNKLKEKYPLYCDSVRGKGLMLGLSLKTISPQIIVKACFEKKLLIASAASDVLRFVPPLVITKEEIDKAMSILDECFKEL